MHVTQVRRGHTFALKKALSHVPAVTVVDMHHNKHVGYVGAPAMGSWLRFWLAFSALWRQVRIVGSLGGNHRLPARVHEVSET